MSQDNLIDFDAERAKRVHDLKEKRLNEMRNAFEQALPLNTGKKKKPKGKPKKRGNLTQVNPAPASCARARAPLTLINFPSPDIG